LKRDEGIAYSQPCRQLRCGLEDLATFLACWFSDRNFNGKQIIPSKAVQALTPTDMSLEFPPGLCICSTPTRLYTATTDMGRA